MNIFTAITAFLSLLATGFAAYATWRSPKSAAELAEAMRREWDRSNEARRLKMYIFSTLMQERAFIASTEAVKALNLIDVVFQDVREVREAWAELYLVFDSRNEIPPHVQEERLRNLLRIMAADVGISNNLRSDDFGRIYYPNSIAQDETIRRLQREVMLRDLQGQAAPNSNAPTSQSNLWPPKPNV